MNSNNRYRQNEWSNQNNQPSMTKYNDTWNQQNGQQSSSYQYNQPEETYHSNLGQYNEYENVNPIVQQPGYYVSQNFFEFQPVQQPAMEQSGSSQQQYYSPHLQRNLGKQQGYDNVPPTVVMSKKEQNRLREKCKSLENLNEDLIKHQKLQVMREKELSEKIKKLEMDLQLSNVDACLKSDVVEQIEKGLEIISQRIKILKGKKKNAKARKRKLLEEKIEEKTMCQICTENKKNRVIIPCGHMMCNKCFVKLAPNKKKNKFCPWCRKKIKRAQKTYH